ncbi:MAG: tetratricopeptide repeat protein [Spirochaetaceae bacterium]|nr:tetratricopeptide repeat protein [Spirochaetaceae bacterium]
MKKFIFLFIALCLFSCNKSEKVFFANINEMDEGHLTSEQMKKRERELKESIRENKNILEQKISTARNLAGYHRMLGKLYLDNKMFLLGAQEFEEAIKIDTENPVLYYYAGLCYARYAKSLVDETFQLTNLLLAEKYYLKAIEYNNNFAKALYAVSVLYVFEFDQPDKAAFYLERLLQTQKRDAESMFLLANAYIRLGLMDKAIAQYDNIIKTSMSSVYKKQAEENKRQLLNSGYGRN